MVNALGVVLVVGGILAIMAMIKNKKSTESSSQEVAEAVQGGMRPYKRSGGSYAGSSRFRASY